MEQKILKATEANIERAARVIKKGGLVIFPTDTVYGLGCDFFNQAAVQRVFMVKGRDENKLMPVLIADLDQLKKLVEVASPLAKELIKKYWPGKLTIIFSTGQKKIGVRMPRHRVTELLIRTAGVPIVGTSANLSGEAPLTDVKDIPLKLLEGVDLVLDGGPSGESIASTVVDVTVKPPQVLRQGVIELKSDEI